MPPTPNITLTAKLDDIAGVAAGTASNPARLRIALCPAGFGAQLPRVNGIALGITSSQFTAASNVQSVIFTVLLPTGVPLPTVGGDVLLAGLTAKSGLNGKSFAVTAAITTLGINYVTVAVGTGAVNEGSAVTETGTMTEAGVMVAKTGPFDYYDKGSGITTPLFGNDQITPAGTYYEIAVIDGEENVVQCAAYIFTGTQEIDLSDAVPVVLAPNPIVTSGNWTLVDASGAGLTFTAAQGSWTQVGNLVTAWFLVVYPSTSNGLQAKIGGLPIPSLSGGGLNTPIVGVGIGVSSGGPAGSVGLQGTTGATEFSAFKIGGGIAGNIFMSQQSFSGWVTYRAY